MSELPPEIAIKPEDGLSWATWTVLMNEERRPGWAYARFPLRSHTDHALFMFGLVRSSFGVFQRKGHLFRVNLAPAEMPLVHVVALRMGIVIATFLNIHEAMEGCEIADQMADWNAVSEDEGPAYQMALARTSAGWSAAALYAQANIAARAGDGQMINNLIVKQPEHLAEDRPEKLS